MPQRENEWYVNRESDLRYCPKCKNWFKSKDWHGGHPKHKNPIRNNKSRNLKDVEIEKLFASLDANVKGPSSENPQENTGESLPPKPPKKDSGLQPPEFCDPDKCPLHKIETMSGPRCSYSEAVSETRDFFKTSTWWLCRYPRIVNFRMLQPADIQFPPTEEPNQPVSGLIPPSSKTSLKVESEQSPPKDDKPIVQSNVTDQLCPRCGHNLSYNSDLFLWICKDCPCAYTKDELQKELSQRIESMKKGTPPQKRTDNSPSEENNGYPTNRPQPPWLASLDEDAPKSYKRVSNGHLTSGCFANAILLIGAILIIGAIWGAIYGISKYHDSAWSWVSREYQVISGKVSDLKDTIADSAPSIFPTQTPNQSQSSVTPSKTPAPTVSITPTVSGVNSRTGQYKNYYLGLADTSEGNLSGNGCYDDTGKFIILINNKNATDPTYSQLVSFLRQNRTDRFPYTYTLNVAGFYYGSAESHVNLKRIQNIIDGTEQPMPPHVCADFAERLHNEAEMAGIRCAYVSIDLSGYSDPYNYGIPSNSGHALNVFQTTDRGLIYVDVTNSPGPSRSVTTVSLQVGKQYIPVSLFPEQGWDSTYSSMGTVTDVQVIWDGTWNN